ncbi:hypothetical protein PHPALM_29340 [Phytophthora palmivora]|uniref:Dynein heavy chain n=1 Tax=Phytophthora palmivora TaxID=4796 RepID=A0A2P4X7V7_9STRA|nr:hypothetical protein PHPALM_29340 [Phytophthora palmivora]
MIEKDVESDQDFEWISQLRYYWAEGVKSANVFDLQARIVNARVRYGYEYLGNTMRLVITPLTDRCYRTMMGAVDLMYGGAPEGPAGTGKTETVKDLSKAIAIQCVVFNCSDGLDYLAMAKFFKGLAGCGSWCCFDEFNRINIEVLSVIAQQILTINEGKKAGVDKFLFEGTFIKLNASANVFITMNPGYAGRAELPDNLKALFRPCAMMVPDYALISEIRLYSFGFAQARSNARKLTQVLQLASEQLSSQKHYDYGMRAVNSILVATGALRQQLGNDPFWTEDKIVLRSVQDVNLPKFTSDDLPLFRGITSDLFPDVLLPLPDHGALLRHIDETCVRGIAVVPDVNVPLECKPEFKMKVVQFYETVQVRHGLMIVGTTGSGKTCVVHSLATAMTSCYMEEIELQEENGTKGAPTLQQRVNIHTMNPKAITSGQLYGNFDENTHEWSDDAVWIENMNTVLDDNKKLCLMSGEIVKMTDRMRMVFETDDLEEASPATVSRVGMVFLEAKVLGWEVLTSANQTQDLIEAKLDKRRKGVLGPPLGQSCVIFVDDLNMPAKETYGAQPPIELLRQWMGHGGWYNRKDNSFTQLVDIQFIAAMGPPGGGRTRITQRYVRYFNLINFVPFDNDSLRAIFTRITDWFLLSFSQGVKQLGGAVVSATIDIYNTISQALLPTPAKSHYTFNLRDLSKVFQGVAQASSDTIKDGKDFVRLWSHECLRVINFVPFDNDSLRAIFTRITDWFLLSFSQGVKQLGGAVVSATIDIYNTISQALLPTPAKSHYTFNLRDLSKVFQGVAQASSDTIKDGKDFVRLWSHECLRVFSDRLIDDKDRAWFADILGKTVKLHFDLQYTAADVRGPNATLIYGNFGGTGDGKNGIKNYAELRDREKLQNAMHVFLEDYNNMSAAPMRLVLFQNAIEHVARISRVIHQPLGNALLVGVGGSGRKSLTTLAVFMAEYKLFQIEISKSYSRTEWRNDIKKVLQLSGLNNQPTVFLFSDTQIVEEAYLEDINDE